MSAEDDMELDLEAEAELAAALDEQLEEDNNNQPAPPTTTDHAPIPSETLAPFVPTEQKPPQRPDNPRAAILSTVVGQMTEDQLDRYEAFRRSSLKKPVQRLIQQVAGAPLKPQDKTLIALASIGKTLVGQIVEEAVKIAEERGEGGAPLQPTHIVAAYERLRDGDQASCAITKPRLML